MPLDIQIMKRVTSQAAAEITIALEGSLDTATSPDLEQQVKPVLASGAKTIVFDLAKLSFISSAGLRIFAATRKVLKERGGQVCFVNMQPQIREVFDIIKALPGLSIFKDAAEMDAYLAARQAAAKNNS